jgi:8-oxo-dGTP pyrophosphatase MutT (NUDIX family)
MPLMKQVFQLDFLEKTQSNIEFIATDTLPQNITLTAVIGMLIRGDTILLTKIPRGWDFPSGHIEENETPEQAMMREVMEETGATLHSLALLGYLELTKTTENELNNRYPLLSAIPVYVSSDFTLPDIFDNKFEAEECKVIGQKDISKHHHRWTPMWNDILEYAMNKSVNS